MIGAAHAGWRGALTGVIEATVAAMEELGAERERIVAALGPAIRQPNYEVGPKGFIKVIDDQTLGLADFAGNRQYITISNLAGNDRAFLFLLDFANRHASRSGAAPVSSENDPALMERLVDPGYRARPERAILFTIEAWDVNCSQHITERYTQGEIAGAAAGLREQITSWRPKMRSSAPRE